jgi:molecular chaperone GrpE (heat shock protein)
MSPPAAEDAGDATPASPPSPSLPAGDGSAIGLRELAELRQLFEARLRYDEAKEKAFDQLFQDLQAAREQLRGDHLQPVFRALIQLHDNARRSCEVLEGEALAHLQAICEGLVDTLYRLDVELIAPTPPRFDRAVQQAVRVEPTDDPALDWTIARVVGEGFRWRERVVRRQQVVVRRLATEDPEGGSNPAT